MAGASEFANLPGLTKEMRDGVIVAFDALSNWRDEIETANERCLGKVLYRTSAIARSMGWPDQAIKAMREYLDKTSKVQTEMIGQILDGWKQQLQSGTAPTAMPASFTGQAAGAMSELSSFTPWNFWLQAAEMWQRTWMPETIVRRDTRSH